MALSGVRKRLASVYKFSPRYCTCLRPTWRKTLQTLRFTKFFKGVRERTYSSLCSGMQIQPSKRSTIIWIKVTLIQSRSFLWCMIIEMFQEDILNPVFLVSPVSFLWLRQCHCQRSPGPGWLRLDWWRSFWRSGSWSPCIPSPPSDPWLNYTASKGRSWTAHLDVRLACVFSVFSNIISRRI